ncbi:hypothetical protein [Prochlorothrix hollandica]|uniref:Uncharacterized protein n=1 Tax=Prochlorothrix hollandica PCC 9006 = CALU 1027 TaxID=317619 RepID=A0A0M2Q138_PROHO|nr:hypothetical protein [Prochlorothrix hollandica]KKJ00679.1 hypothetical protein PROH_05150 [Prochlorothrix hollandica PCC 9006 = CALU 1027]
MSQKTDRLCDRVAEKLLVGQICIILCHSFSGATPYMNPDTNLPVALGNPESRSGEPGRSVPTSGHTAAVPISIYRELADELQLTKTELDRIRQENGKLVDQNRQLRQEADQVVSAAQTLQKLAQRLALSPPGGSVAPYTTAAAPLDSSNRTQGFYGDLWPGDSPSDPPPDSPDLPRSPAFPPGDPGDRRAPAPQLHYDRPQPDGVASSSLDRDSLNSGGLWLVLTVILIVVTAFGTGFLIVRPFLPQTSK